MELEQGMELQSNFYPYQPVAPSKGSAWLHTQVQEHSPVVSSSQKTHSGVTFLCNKKTTGPGQDAAGGLLPGQHI